MQTTTHTGYTAQQQAALTQELEGRFGRVARVLRDELPELCVIHGEAGTTLVTQGMGARAMNTPNGEHSRAELVMHLPPGWDITGRDERDHWPLRWLRLLADLPFEENTWLGWGHTVPGGGPFAEDTGFDSLLLLDAFVPLQQSGDGPCEITLPGGLTITLYQLFPLYPEELRFKLEHGAQALVERLMQAKLLLPVLDPMRENCFLPPKPLRLNWVGPDQCLATMRILEDGAPVGYCYREAPCNGQDSGWRFTAGDESDDYMEDPACSGVVPLERIAGCDADILPILETPAPCAFARGVKGLEQLKNIR